MEGQHEERTASFEDGPLSPTLLGGLEAMTPANDPGPLRGFHRLAAGFGSSAAGIVFLAAMFTEADPVVGLPAALTVGLVVSLGVGYVIPNAKLPK
ncbi:hypothetical protein [Halopiger djelfimassiliensis]|uniref:hypothetical protein n=1 Tax=Halopiger djelfimassiliensis TaxID=1293047 RepID=UPI0006779729|nr:hypothetical protein [Halopiger djelfimassiliensis]